MFQPGAIDSLAPDVHQVCTAFLLIETADCIANDNYSDSVGNPSSVARRSIAVNSGLT